MKCLACSKDATVRYSPDLDIKGIGACDEHSEMIRTDIMFCSLDLISWEDFDSKYKKLRDEAKGKTDSER